MKMLVEVNDLSRYYGLLRALDRVNLSLKCGEILGLLGTNGAGKTTTLSLISGTLAPTEGRIIVDGYDLLDQPRLAKARIGYLPERLPLYLDMQVCDYLDYCLRLRLRRPPSPRSMVTEAMEITGITSVARRLIGHLSKGYQQRVGIAQAIVHNPSVVILDEPTVGLDPLQIREIRALIKSLSAERGILLSTHLIPEAATLCDRVTILHQGRVAFSAATTKQGAASPGLVLTLQVDLEATILESFPGIEQAARTGPGSYKLGIIPGHDPRPDLLRAALSNQWGLLAMIPIETSLEDIFLSVISKENLPYPRRHDA